MRNDVRKILPTWLPRVVFWLILALVWTLPSGVAQATAPSSLKLSYDAATRTLQVTITHPSSFPTSHYIKNVEIRKDGKTILSQNYKSQPDAPAFSYSYRIQAAPGDILEVKASCSLWGSRTEKLTISAAK
jgi:hypothetical protein